MTTPEISRYMARQGRKGGQVRGQTQSPRKLSRQGHRAVMIRWHGRDTCHPKSKMS